MSDYIAYGQQPDTGYLFEAAATEMAAQINNIDPQTAIWLDKRYWDGWPSIRFLTQGTAVALFTAPEELALLTTWPSRIYVWPYDDYRFIGATFPRPSLVTMRVGSLARGDLEPAPYPLYISYDLLPGLQAGNGLANFDNQIQLHQAQVTAVTPQQLNISLEWTAAEWPQPLVAFVHVHDEVGFLGQHDAPPGQGYWPESWWQPGLHLREERTIWLERPIGLNPHSIHVGLYPANKPAQRLPALNENGSMVGDSWQLSGP